MTLVPKKGMCFFFSDYWKLENQAIKKKKKNYKGKNKEQWLLGNPTESTGMVMLFQPSKMYLNEVLDHIQAKVIVTR